MYFVMLCAKKVGQNLANIDVRTSNLKVLDTLWKPVAT